MDSEDNTPKPSIDQMSPHMRQMRSPVPEAKSPIRPQNPDPLKPKLTPSLTRPTKPETPIRTTEIMRPVELDEKLTPEEKALRAIEDLSQKMEKVAQEFQDGIINKDQFHAIYRRYNEQRDIVERILHRNPESEAWQSVVRPGHTTFLRDQYAAHILSYAIYYLENNEQIILHGNVRLPAAQLHPFLGKIRQVVTQGHKLGAAWRELKDRNWVVIIPGQLSVSVVIFSAQPAPVQLKKVEDAHRDFERANEKMLQRGDLKPESLVFPHRAIVES